MEKNEGSAGAAAFAEAEDFTGSGGAAVPVKQPSQAVIARLPRYYRQLKDLLEDDVLRISSGKLAQRMNCSASQIRQDLSCFGGFGQQGYGYNVKRLFLCISDILKINDEFGAVLVGAGDLSRALAADPMFAKHGVILREIFAASSSAAEKLQIGGHAVRDIGGLEAYLTASPADIIVLTEPLPAALTAARLSELGVRGVWNFTSDELRGSDKLAVSNICLGDSLMTLCYYIKR